MKVWEHTTYSQSLTDPSRNEWGITFALRGGDVCDPMNGNWFREPWPTFVIRFFAHIACLPWIAWNLWGWQGYIGFKCYGVDAPEYKNWIDANEVYDGSQAMCFSMRLRMRT